MTRHLTERLEDAEARMADMESEIRFLRESRTHSWKRLEQARLDQDEAHAEATKQANHLQKQNARIRELNDQIADLTQRLPKLETDTALVPIDLLKSLTSDDDCDIDHNNSCQAHGYDFLADGEKCPQDQLKILIGKSYYCGGK